MNYIIHLITAIIFSLFIYTAGLLILSCFKATGKQKLFGSIFLRYIVGTVALLIGYAIIITGLKTIYSIALLAFIVFLLISNTRFQNIKSIKDSIVCILKKDLKSLLILQIILLALIVYQYISTGYIFGIHYNSINEDISYYITLAEYLNYTGIENKNTFYNDFLQNPITGISPYHYFDLYISGFLFKTITFLNNMVIYNFIFLPFCFFLIIMSFISVFESQLEHKTLLIIFLSFIFTYYVGYFPASAIGIKGVEFLGGFGTAPFKYVPSFVFLAAIWLLYQNRQNYQTALLIALMTTLSIIYLYFVPVMLLFLGLSVYKQNKTTGISTFKPLIIPITAMLGIALIYWLFGENADHLLIGKEQQQPIIDIIDFKLAKTIVFYSFFTSIAFFIPLYAIIIISLKKQFLYIKSNLRLFLFLGGIFVFGIFGHALYQSNDESWQLSDIFYGPIIKIGLGLLVSYSIFEIIESSKRKLVFLFLPIAFTLFFSVKFYYNQIASNKYSFAFSNEFIESIKPYSEIIKTGVVIIDTTGFKNSNMKARPSLATFGGVTKFIAKKSAYFSISVPAPEELLQFSSEKIIKENFESPLGEFYQINKDKHFSMESAQYDFIKHHNIKSILSPEHLKLPVQLQSMVKASIIDNKTKQVLYILK